MKRAKRRKENAPVIEPTFRVKLHQGHFVTVFPMIEPRPEDRGWAPNPSRKTPHRYYPDEPDGLLRYAQTRSDQED